MEPWSRSGIFKGLSRFTLLTFLTQQILWANPEALKIGETVYSAESSVESGEVAEPSITLDSPSTSSTDFLQDTLALEPAPSQTQSSENLDYEYERYSLEDALDLMRPEFASAVILEKPLSEGDVEAILTHSIKEGIEIAIVVLHGETVLLTTGSGDEIAASGAAQKILAQATFAAHTHPDAHSREGPTGPDLVAAGDSTHYLLTQTSAYAYTGAGVVSEGGIAWVKQQYDGAQNQDQRGQTPGGLTPSASVRQELNRLIAEQDKLNQMRDEELETWLAGGTVSYNSKLTSASVTTLPARPYPYYLTGSSAGTTLSQVGTTNQFNLGYNVTQTGSYSGMVLSFDNASTPAVETQNLSAFSRLVFGLKGLSGKVKLKFVDANGNTDLFTLKSISASTERFYKIPTANIIAAVDKTKIKEIQIYLDQSTTASAYRKGTQTIRISGLNTGDPTSPVLTSFVPAATNKSILTLSGTKEAHTAVFVNGTQVIARDTATTWSYTASLPSDATYAFEIQTKNTIGKLSAGKSITVIKDTVAPALSIAVNNNAAYTISRTVTVALTASDDRSGLLDMGFAINNTVTSPYSAWEPYAATKTLTLPDYQGADYVNVRVRDKAGNVKYLWKRIILDTVAPTGSVSMNDGAELTNSRDVTLTLTGSDATSGVDVMRFSTDGGVNWSAWEAFATSRALTLPNQDGTREVRYQLKDKAGNASTFTDTIVLSGVSAVEFLSETLVTDPIYTLRYRVDGVEKTETWRLHPGENELLIAHSASDNNRKIFQKLIVTLNQTEDAVPAMPDIPVLAEGLLSLTTDGGFILKYDQGTLVAVESPGNYTLYLPEFDAAGNLTGGLLRYVTGSRLLFASSAPVYEIAANGAKTYYYTDGVVRKSETADGQSIRFAYRLDAEGKTLSVLSMEDTVTSLYRDALPDWIVMKNGTDIRYDQGLLLEYRDAAGNLFQYLVTEIRQGTVLTGYKVKLEWVRPASAAAALAIATVLANLASYPSVKTTLENDLALEMEFDAQKNMTKVTSGKNEVLTLSGELPTSLRDSQGVTKLIQSQLNAKGELESLLIQESGVNQSFDGLGKLSDVRLSDGTVLEVRELKVSEVILSDGSVLSGLKWNGTNLTDFLRTKADGTKETYVNSRLIRKEEPNGNITTYFFEASRNQDRPNQLTTKDGRTYKFIEYTNAQGLVESLTELTTIDLPDGNQIQFEAGKPIRYIQKKTVQLDPYEVPVLPAGRSFVPSVRLAAAEMRSLTIDQNATILSGEILFNDGTQYVIKDGDLFQQITPDGRLIEFSTLPPVTLPKPDPILGVPLTSAEATYKTQLIETQLDYFRNGVGLDALTGLPLDNFKSDTGVASDYSQATLVGFWAEILSAVARKDYTTTRMTQLQAFQSLLQVLTETRKAQQQAGWNGMLAFFKIVKTVTSTGTTVTYQRQFDSIGIGDNLNMSLSLATVIGALSGITLDTAMNDYRNQIIVKANEILTAQDTGYAQFYDAGAGRFRMAHFLAGPKANTFEGAMDRVFNEFRSGLVWLAARNSTYKTAVDNLDVAVRPYKTDDGRLIDLAVPFDGGAFQMFWPLIHVDETKYAEFDVALKNFLYAQAEYVQKTGVPGLLSAGDDPLKGYNGKMGLKATAETDDPLVEDVGSLYATASAFLLAPHYALQLLKNIETKYPAIKTSLNGYIDSLAVRNSEAVVADGNLPVYSKQSFGVDQASFMLSLMKTSQIYFDNYLKQADLATGFDSIYKTMSFGLNPAALANPPPPAFGANPPVLYTGSSTTPDGRSPELLKTSSFLSTIFDPDFGEGKVASYINPDGKFHHIEIEFGEGTNIKRMNAQEYLLLPGRGDFARTIFEGIRLDLLNEATSSGAFYTPGSGFANGVLTLDPKLGEVRRLEFDFREVTKPVGLWHQYVPPLDLSKYDYISVPVRFSETMPAGANLKFELKGLGEIFVTTGLTKDWQYLQIPVVKPAGLLKEIAIVVQSPDGTPFAGEFYLGPISAFKVRTSKSVDWLVALGKTDSELRTLLKQKIAAQATGGGTVQGEESLENFLIDAGGKLVEGTLKLADGSIQYFSRSRLNKWVFKNGRTVLFEKGLATFVFDLAKGKLEQARFYYDANFKGEIKSVVIQDNDRKRIFGSDGSLQTMVDLGSFVNMKDGKIDSIVTSKATLTELLFADDGSLLKAHVKLTDGLEFDIDNTAEQVIVRPNGVKVYYKGSRITAVETPANGKTTFTYTLNALAQLMGVDAAFTEVVNGVSVVRTLSIFDYLQRPERNLEKGEILREAPRDIIPLSSIGGFSVGWLPSGEVTWGRKGDFGYNSAAWYQFRYNTTTGPIIGMHATHTSAPSTIPGYDFIEITLQQDPGMTWAQDFNLKLKTPQFATLYNFQVDNTPTLYKSYGFPLAGKSGFEGEVTLEVVRESAGVGQTGTVYIKDISYFSVKTLDRPLWENEIGLTAADLLHLKIESGNLVNVGAEVASGKPLLYPELVPMLDLPSWVRYTDKSATDRGVLLGYKRFDGAEVSVTNGTTITKVTLPDGTVNEYSAAGNTAQNIIKGPDSASSTNPADYQYGALRKVTQADGRAYEFSYEFDTDGNEITVLKDSVTGDERRFKEGKLLVANSTNQLETRYGYEGGELALAELTYKNRVIESTRYHFTPEETQITDERGTTWYYDRNGNLIKHLTKDGYLFEYSDYTQALDSQVLLDPADFKNAIFTAADLKAVRLIGYEMQDGSRLLFNQDDIGEIKLAAGDQAVNLIFDSLGRIKEGQIQFANGIVISIENYLPVRGRRADGSVFTINFPAASSRELLLHPDGSFENIRIEIDGKVYLYDFEGKLIKASFPDPKTFDFTYTKDAGGAVTGYQTLETSPLVFRGVPYPKAVDLKAEGSGAGRTLKFGEGSNDIALQTGSGFVAGVFNKASGAWDTLTGSFNSAADRFALKSFLQGIKPGDYAAALISDAAFSSAGTSQEKEDVFQLLEGLGSGKIREAAASGNDWSFFGMKGLSSGEGAEALSAPGSTGTFSSAVQTTTTNAVSGGTTPLFDSVPVLLYFPVFEFNTLVQFLAQYKKVGPDPEVQALSVYNSKDELVYSRRLDQVTTYYENGKARETYDEKGELLYAYEYDSEGNTKRIQILKARHDFEEKIAQLREKIEQEKFDALYALAWRDEAARQKVKEEVDNGLQAIASGISQLEAQRFQDVKQCKRGFLGIGKTCKHFTIEVPGVADAINRLQGERSNLLETQARELGKIGAEIESKRSEVETASREQMTSLDEEEQKFKDNVLHQEMDPILYDFYRKILGRDPSTQEIDQWTNTYRPAGVIDTVNLANTLTALPERQEKLNQKDAIITGVEAFLQNYLAQTTDVDRQNLLNRLKLSLQEVVSLDSAEVTETLDWLKSRDLHFGQSAFLSLKEMLASRGADRSIEVLGKESILIDILTGVINRFTEGELLISFFALDRTARIHGQDFSGVKYTVSDLKALYAGLCPDSEAAPAGGPAVCSLRLIALIGEDHFVVITKVTDTEVSYRETTKGEGGEEFTIPAEEFLKVWADSSGEGYLMVPDQYVIEAKRLTDEEAQRVRGAFFWLILVWLAAIIAKIAAVVYAVVTLIVHVVLAVVTAVLNAVVNTIGFIFAKITEGITLLGRGFFNLGKLLYQGIKFAGRFVMKGFQFLKEGFKTGLQRLGSGISKLKNFLLKPTGKPLVDALGHNILDANGNILRHFSFQQVVARNAVAAGLNYSTSKGLEGLGLNPTLVRLGSAFVGAGFMGIGSAASSFLKSGLQGLLLQGVSEMGLKLNLPPPITGAISLLTGAALNAYFDPDLTLKQALKTVVPTAAEKLTLGGFDLIGRSLGLDWRLQMLLDVPIRATVGEIMQGINNPNVGIFNSIKNSLLSSQTIAGAISIGASIGLDAIGAPPILQSFVPGILGQLAASASGNTGGEGGPGTSRNIFSRIVDTAKNFGGMIFRGVQNVINFGVDVLQQGFEKAIDLFGSVFNRQTQEIMYEASVAGPTGAGSGWQKIGSFTDENGFKTVHYENANGNTMVVKGQLDSDRLDVVRNIGGVTSSESYEGLGRTSSGFFGFSNVAFAQETQDGIKINQTIYDTDKYEVSLSDARNDYELYKYQVDDDKVTSFEQSLLAFAYGNDISRLRSSNSDDVVLADLGGFRKSQLNGLNFKLDFSSGANETTISASLASETNTQALSQIQTILQQTGQSLQEFSEKLKNSIALLGSRTDREIAEHKSTEINEVLSSTDKIWVINTKTSGGAAYATRRLTRLGSSNDGVNHSALTFKDKNGMMYVIEIVPGGSIQQPGLNTDILVRPFEEWATQYIDIDAQALPISSEQADKFRQDVIFGKYVDLNTMLPKLKLNYDVPGAGGEGFGVPIAKADTRKICSELVCDIITEGTGHKFEPIDEDGYISPNELRQRIDEWIKNEEENSGATS